MKPKKSIESVPSCVVPPSSLKSSTTEAINKQSEKQPTTTMAPTKKLPAATEKKLGQQVLPFLGYQTKA
jgi:hypothetical protein